jgi:NADPH:quinone reductase-like Zn-dependent oxidoreductase
MKAVQIHEYGGPDVLIYEEAPRPTPAADEVLVRVHAAAVNPVDWKVRQGYLKDYMALPLPFIVGWDFSGVIEALGKNVRNFREGEAVFGREEASHKGAYAEYIAPRAAFLARKPDALDHVTAAAIPIAGLTAWQSLFDVGHLAGGQKILIQGAAGGVGTFAVQLAKWKGAYVVGTSSARNLDFLKKLGVNEAIDYHAARFEDVVHDMDMVFDCVGGDVQKRSFDVIRPGGILVSIVGSPDPNLAAAKGIRVAGGLAKPNAAQLEELARLVVTGKLKVIVSTVLPVSEASKAHELSQSGHTRGKIVLQVSDRRD